MAHFDDSIPRFLCLNKNGLIQQLGAQFHSILKLKVEVSKSCLICRLIYMDREDEDKYDVLSRQ